MRIIDMKFDDRTKCQSILTSMKVSDYLELIKKSFQSGGNIDGQRGVQKSASATKIRKRMIQDYTEGALFPPVVIGFLSDRKFEENDDSSFFKEIKSVNLSIIDGIQRTNVYFSDAAQATEKEIRVEFWVAESTTQLLYRMLVLNTGQVPWTTKRQIEVIYDNLAKQIEGYIYRKYDGLKGEIQLINVDDNQRRVTAGKYQKTSVIESYIGYTTQKIKINMNEEIANEFQRFDMMESLEDNHNFDFFIDAFAMMIYLDMSFNKFENGKSIFSSTPACVGFMVASGEYVLGLPSLERSSEKKFKRNELFIAQINKLISKAEEQKDKGNDDFLALETLNTVISNLPKNRIGDDQRQLYKNSFSDIIRFPDIDEISSLHDFWSM